MAEMFGIPERLRELRGEMTQADLAAVSGVSLNTIQNVEAGKSPTVTTLNALAGALKVSVMSFFAGDRAAMDAFIKHQLRNGPNSHEISMSILFFARSPALDRGLAMSILTKDTSHLDGVECAPDVLQKLEALIASLP